MHTSRLSTAPTFASATTALALAALMSTLVVPAPASAVPEERPPTPSAGHGSHRAPTSGWVRISDTPVDVLSRPGLLRTSDGVLHIVYVADEAGQDALVHAEVAAGRSVSARHRLVTGWVGLEHDAELVARPDGGLRALFGGTQTTVTDGSFFNKGRLYSAVSDPTRTSWSVPTESIGRAGGAGWGGIAGAMLPDGRPFGLRTSYKGLAWYAGTTTDPAVEPEDPSYAPDATVADPAVSVVGDRVFASWHALGHTDDTTGVRVMQVHPSVGPEVKAPDSGTAGMGTSDAALATSSTGHLYAAYPVGSASITGYRLWNVSTGHPLRLRDRNGYGAVAVSPGSEGRMWMAWKSGYDEVSVVRTNRSGTRASAPQAFELPGDAPIHHLALASGGDYADVVVNAGGSMLLHRFMAGLHVAAAPSRLRAGRTRSVSFRVTDAGDAVRGARVRAAGAVCRTNAGGRCTLRLAPSRPQRITVKAAARGHADGSTVLRVRR